MNIIRIVQGLGAAPDDGKGGRQLRRFGRVREIHGITVDGIAEQLRVDAGHPTFDVELTHEPRLDDELTDDMHFDLDGLFRLGRHQDLRPVAGDVDGRAEPGPGPVAGPDPADARHEDVVAAVLGRVVRTAVGFHAPIARELRGDALRTGQVGAAVEERELGRHDVRPLGGFDRELRVEVVWKKGERLGIRYLLFNP